jgi:hypothetical protein
MSPQELLVATEKAVSRERPSQLIKNTVIIVAIIATNFAIMMFQVGPPDMWQNHQDLIKLGKKGKDMEVIEYFDVQCLISIKFTFHHCSFQGIFDREEGTFRET